MICRVCHQEMNEFEMIHGCRSEHFVIFEKPHTVSTDDYMMYQCPNCSHFQIEYCLPENYFDSYVSGMTGKSQYTGLLDQWKGKVRTLSKFSRNHTSIIEIGCGNPKGGGAYEEACKQYKRYLGIEPSQEECECAKKAGVPIIQGYFNWDLHLQETFSAFMTFQVFHMLVDLYSVLDYAFEVLEPDGVGLINVPNGQRIVQKNLYHQVVGELINYFTPYSLAVMARKAGFEIIQIEDISETVELDLYVRKPGGRKTFEQAKRDQQHLQGCTSIAIWGAGSKAPVYSHLLQEENPIHYLLDSSKEKIGRYIGNIPVPVQAVSKEALQNSDAIVIFASSYNKEITEKLKHEFNYTGKIIYFEDQIVKYC